MDQKKRIVVGVNDFLAEEEQQFDYLRVDPKVEEEQIARLNKVRKKRDLDGVKSTLDALKAGAERDANLMPSILDSVRAYATLGEICGVLRDVFGEYKAPDIL